MSRRNYLPSFDDSNQELLTKRLMPSNKINQGLKLHTKPQHTSSFGAQRK